MKKKEILKTLIGVNDAIFDAGLVALDEEMEKLDKAATLIAEAYKIVAKVKFPKIVKEERDWTLDGLIGEKVDTGNDVIDELTDAGLVGEKVEIAPGITMLTLDPKGN